MSCEISIEQLPQACINDCSASGAVDDAVAYWLEQEPVRGIMLALNPEAMRDHLRGYGAWEDDELADAEQNRARVLWLACGTFRDFQIGGPDCGSDFVYLER